MWRKSVKWRNRLSYGEISPHEKYGAKSVMWRNCLNNVYNLWCFNAYYAVLLQNLLILRFTLFCRKICFVAIYALLRGEKLSKKLCPWRKKDKYHVCLYVYTPTLHVGADTEDWSCHHLAGQPATCLRDVITRNRPLDSIMSLPGQTSSSIPDLARHQHMCTRKNPWQHRVAGQADYTKHDQSIDIKERTSWH